MIPRLLVTSGEPAGIGPDIVLTLSQSRWDAQLIILADPNLLSERAARLGISCHIEPVENVDALPAIPAPAGTLFCLPIRLRQPATPGQLDPANAPHVLEQLARATDMALTGQVDGVVTAPVHKGIINAAGYPFTGHTEFFQQRTDTPEVVMMLATPGLRVALATTHLPLRAVSDAITPDKLRNILLRLHAGLQQDFGLRQPHILVAGLNPHAGEDGHLGDEEIRIIEPTLTALRQQGLNLTGPLPADTLFTPPWLEQADAVLAMYHDQGLPVLKHMGFGHAVNITLGLPFIRTSVDHGTALELAGTGQARAGSLHYAIEVALEMIHARQSNRTDMP